MFHCLRIIKLESSLNSKKPENRDFSFFEGNSYVKSKLTESLIVAIRGAGQGSLAVAEVYRKQGIKTATYCFDQVNSCTGVIVQTKYL